MNWLADNARTLDAVLAHHPDLKQPFEVFYATIWREQLVPHSTLELCRLRIATIHQADAEWQLRNGNVDLSPDQLAAIADLTTVSTDHFDAGDRAALAIADLMPFAHHQIADDHIANVTNVFGPGGTVALLIACSFFDVIIRMKLVFATDAEATVASDMPFHAGALA